MIVRPTGRPPGQRPGMTLLEVLIAMAIFIISLTALSQLIEIGGSSALDATFHADGTRLAQSKLAEVEAGAVAPDSSTSGTFDSEVGWQWKMDSSQTSVPYVFLVTVTVSRQPGGVPHTVAMSQMVFDSRQMGKSNAILNPVTNASTVAAPTTGATTP